MVDDLTTSLLAAIDKTEKIAREVAADVGPTWSADESGVISKHPSGERYGLIQPLWAPLRDYLAAQDPETALRRCDADRRIVQHFQVIENLVNDPNHRFVSPAALTALRPVINRLVEAYRLDAEEVDDECE